MPLIVTNFLTLFISPAARAASAARAGRDGPAGKCQSGIRCARRRWPVCGKKHPARPLKIAADSAPVLFVISNLITHVACHLPDPTRIALIIHKEIKMALHFLPKTRIKLRIHSRPASPDGRGHPPGLSPPAALDRPAPLATGRPKEHSSAGKSVNRHNRAVAFPGGKIGRACAGRAACSTDGGNRVFDAHTQ